jgi:hypothetical protein
VKIRLGYKKPGQSFPKDSDVFVGRTEDGVSKEILEAYGKGRIDEAEGEVWNLGKSLRMLSYFEWDALSPQDERELVVELMNRAWSHSKLRCVGDGGDQPGTASAADEEWAKAIQKVTRKAPVLEDSGRYRVVCLGPKCPMWSSNLATNKQATCHRELRLRARLLHPETDPEKPDYLKQLGWVEIASGSWNGAIDIQSGLQFMRSVAGRSAGIPFTLKRAPRTVLSDGKRLTKATLMVDYDHDEAIRFGFSDPKLVLVRPESRKQLEAMKREQLELAALGVEFDSFKDVVPRLEGSRPQLTAGNGSLSATSGEVEKGEALTADRDEVVQDAVDEAAPRELSPAELNRLLSKDERNELKVLAGGVPGQPATLVKLRELVAAAYRAFDERPSDLSDLRVRHALWIKDALAQESRDSDQREAAATESAGLESQRHEETPGAVNPDSPESVQQELIK